MSKSIRENVIEVRARIEAAARRAGGDAAMVRCLAATKNRSVAEIREALQAGVTVLGENRAQEFLSKAGEIGGEAEWHFIGHLQRNKVKSIVGRVALIHSVDSARLAEEVNARAERIGIRQAVLLQVNVAGEESKWGARCDEAEGLLDSLRGMSGLEFKGFSTIAPLVGDAEDARWVFKRLRELGEELGYEAGRSGCELSMGMTGDFEVAVEEGSTIVRVGTAIFETGGRLAVE